MKAVIKVGIIGVGRGISFYRSAAQCGMKLVALCDRWESKLRQYREHLGIATYADYDAFLEHDMDAVILANNFHQHAPFAIKALEAGFHVMSEIGSCGTPAEGVALARAVEKSGRIYMCGENVPYAAIYQEMQRLFGEGFIGRFLYGEGEYVHPTDAWKSNWLAPRADHWRKWIPATYYCMQSLGPIMYVTGARPVKVNGFLVPRVREGDPHGAMSSSKSDGVGMMVCGMDNGAMVKLLQSFGPGGLGAGHHHLSIFGNKGLMEKANDGSGRLLLRQEAWHAAGGQKLDQAYVPEFAAFRAEASKTGHQGADFFVDHTFAEAIRRQEQPFFDVYRGIEMSLVGILAYRSGLQGGMPLEIPDLRQESARQKYAQDDWTPDPEKRKPGQPFSSMLGDIQPSAAAEKYAALVREANEKHWSGRPWKHYNIDFSVTGEYGPEHMQKLAALKSLEFQ